MIKVLPSSNPEKEENLVHYVKELECLGIEYLHCDVMDGLFVENKCLSIDTIRSVRNNTNIGLDVHLMINKPHKKIDKYISLNPNIITVHCEASSFGKIKKMSKLVRSNDILFGVSIKPNTSVSELVKLIDYVDLILVMSVEPGKSGQKFIENSISRIKDVKSLINDKNIIVEVDGGINLDNFENVIKAGAEFLVMGSAFYNSKDRQGLLTKIDKHYQTKVKN